MKLTPLKLRRGERSKLMTTLRSKTVEGSQWLNVRTLSYWKEIVVAIFEILPTQLTCTTTRSAFGEEDTTGSLSVGLVRW